MDEHLITREVREVARAVGACFGEPVSKSWRYAAALLPGNVHQWALTMYDDNDTRHALTIHVDGDKRTARYAKPGSADVNREFDVKPVWEDAIREIIAESS